MTLLPADFSELEPFAARWCLATEADRWDRRHQSSMDEMRDLYEAVQPRVEDAVAYCDRYPLHDLPDDARRLLQLLMSFVMVSFPVEVWDAARIPDSGHATLDRIVSPAY